MGSNRLNSQQYQKIDYAKRRDKIPSLQLEGTLGISLLAVSRIRNPPVALEDGEQYAALIDVCTSWCALALFLIYRHFSFSAGVFHFPFCFQESLMDAGIDCDKPSAFDQ